MLYAMSSRIQDLSINMLDFIVPDRKQSIPFLNLVIYTLIASRNTPFLFGVFYETICKNKLETLFIERIEAFILGHHLTSIPSKYLDDFLVHFGTKAKQIILFNSFKNDSLKANVLNLANRFRMFKLL